MAFSTVARPDKTVGRVVLGPRVFGTALLRIISRDDGSGQIQFYDHAAVAWANATELWTFSDVWSAPPATDAKYLVAQGRT